MKELDLIQQFEPLFIEAAKMAMKMRKTAKVENKSNTGITEIDIVTDADLAVQEFVLKKLAESDLRNCELVAEEKTAAISLFSKKSDIVLTLDPIDGTANYAKGGQLYSIIASLHDKKNPLYTFDYFPEINWGLKIVGDKVSEIGTKPDLSNVVVPQKTIGYFHSSDPKGPNGWIPELYRKYTEEGYAFKNKHEWTKGYGAVFLFLLGKIDGCLVRNGSAVDCLTALHLGLAKGYKIYRDIDITRPQPRENALDSAEYKGYYLVAKES